VKESNLRELERLLTSARKAGGDSYAPDAVSQLVKYYGMVLKWNSRLHLTTITEPAEFLSRHIFESSMVESLLPEPVRSVWDLGSGVGVPGIPVSILRSDLHVHLVESNRAKSIFLDEVVYALGLGNAEVHRARFESLDPPPVDSCVTARAVERMEKIIPKILEFGSRSDRILIFGNADLALLLSGANGANIRGGRSLLTHPVPDCDNSLLVELTRST
jgi:16S rRNA (guanine527-N7)-methyltransferase